ncbi:hypothetical protein HYDPIDRAFT_51296, partial [Hydnomerulius pinastri MD-312]
VHWRMESVPVQNLAWCAASMVNVLQGLLQDDLGENIRNLWFATDYPIVLYGATRDENDSGKSPRYGAQRSSTFKYVAREHDDAIEVLREAFQPGGELDSWKLTDLSEQLRRYPYVEGRLNIENELLEDSGIYGILDKLVVVQSQVFVSGAKECSKASSFTRQIIEARQEVL